MAGNLRKLLHAATTVATSSIIALILWLPSWLQMTPFLAFVVQPGLILAAIASFHWLDGTLLARLGTGVNHQDRENHGKMRRCARFREPRHDAPGKLRKAA